MARAEAKPARAGRGVGVARNSCEGNPSPGLRSASPPLEHPLPQGERGREFAARAETNSAVMKRSHQRRLALGVRLRRRRVLQAEDAPRVVVEQLVLVGVGQLDVLQELQARRRVPARIVGAVHHVVDAVVVDRELHAFRMRRHRIGVHALEIRADRLRQLRRLGVLVHAAGLVGQRAAGVRHHDLEVGMALHRAGEHEPHRRDADLDDAAEAQMQRAVIAVRQHVLEDHVGRMQEQRQAELGAMRVERLQPLGVDARILADAAGQVDAHQAEPVDRVVDHLDGDLGVLQRHRGAGPEPARIFLLRAGHLLVPHQRVVAAFLDRHVGERHRERADRADHVDAVAEAVHVFELLVEIEPLGPGVEMLAAGVAAHVVVAAALVDARLGEVLALAELLENRAGPPMKMRIDDVHGRAVLPLAHRPDFKILEGGLFRVNAPRPGCMA